MNTTTTTNSTKTNPSFVALERTCLSLFYIFVEVFNGIRKNTLNWLYCGSWIILANVIVLLGLDILAFKYFGWLHIYQKFSFLFWIFYIPLCFFGFFSWAALQRNNKRKLLEQLTNAFVNSGLSNVTGKVPNFIADNPIDENTRKLVVTSEHIPLKKFKEKKQELETGLRVYIDDFKERREKGIIDIYYSHIAMPSHVEVTEPPKEESYKYLIGSTRSKTVKGDFRLSPHLLVAGQSGGGKSNLLKQIITSLYLNNKTAKFTLVDLKEGLEFQVYKDVERITVSEEFDSILSKIATLDTEMTRRMKIIKGNDCKDIDAYHKKIKNDQTKRLDRHFICIDEAAEIFLATSGEKTEKVQKARKGLSRIARLGRACGVHLIIATQRPDVKAVDPQVKTNLTSIVCFQMPNLASSMTVLSNGRAAHLPSETPGRGLWKDGGKMVEVQTPYISTENITKWMAPYKKRKAKTNIKNDNQELSDANIDRNSQESSYTREDC